MTPSTTWANTPLRKIASGLAVAAFWAAVWQLAYLRVAQEILLVSPVQAVLRLFALMGEAAFWRSIAASCLRVVAGFGAAMAAGTLLAALSARFRVVWRLTQPIMGVVRATPVASFILLLLVWVFTDRIPVIIAFLVVVPIFWGNLTAGLASVDSDLLEMARVFRLSRLGVLRYVYLPAEAPHFASACSAGLGLAWKSAVAAEVIARPGLAIGRALNDAKVYLDTADLFAWTMAVILLSLLIEKTAIRLLRALTDRLGRGHVSRRAPSRHRRIARPSKGEGEPLSLAGVAKHFDGKTVLEGFSHTFPETGLVALTGPSGAGKTTLLRLIAGLSAPDEGAVRLPEGARVSVVFQEDRLLPTLDARGNLLAVLPGGATPENIALADRCLAACGLAGEETRYPAQLSGGMRRRVAIARAVAWGGDILLLDEPFKGLDDALRRRVMDFALAGRDRALILLVTHDGGEAALADRVLRLEK